MNQTHFNNSVFEEMSSGWFEQQQLKKVMLHELGHKLYRDGFVDAGIVIDLWKTKERISQQAELDFEENFCESWAGYLMSLSDVGDIKDNFELNEFKEDLPETYKILSKLRKDLNEN